MSFSQDDILTLAKAGFTANQIIALGSIQTPAPVAPVAPVGPVGPVGPIGPKQHVGLNWLSCSIFLRASDMSPLLQLL